MTVELRPEGRRILVSAPFGRDGESLAALLHDQGYNAIVCRDLTVIADSVGEDIGVIVLTEEALNGNVERLKQKLQQQPSWSDIPFLLLAAPRNSRSPNAQLSKLALFDLASNSVVLERPCTAPSPPRCDCVKSNSRCATEWPNLMKAKHASDWRTAQQA